MMKIAVTFLSLLCLAASAGVVGTWQSHIAAQETTLPNWWGDHSSGIVAAWRFGVANDYTDHVGTNSMFLGGDAYVSSGNGLIQDGTNDYAQILSSSDLKLTNFTFTAWIYQRVDKPNVFPTIYAVRNDENNEYGFKIDSSLNGNDIRAYIEKDGYTFCASGVNPVNETWTHVAVVVSNGDLTILIDAVRENFTSGSKPPNYYDGASNVFQVGSATKYAGYWAGRIDEVYFLTNTLSDAAVGFYYTNSYNADFSTR